MAPPTNPLETCIHLRSKQMFYETATTRDAEHDAEIARRYGSWDTTSFWCQVTQTGRGPDEAVVGRRECCAKNRSCFLGIEGLARATIA